MKSHQHSIKGDAWSKSSLFHLTTVQYLRELTEPVQSPTVHIFATHFYSTLISNTMPCTVTSTLIGTTHDLKTSCTCSPTGTAVGCGPSINATDMDWNPKKRQFTYGLDKVLYCSRAKPGYVFCVTETRRWMEIKTIESENGWEAPVNMQSMRERDETEQSTNKNPHAEPSGGSTVRAEERPEAKENQ